MAASCAVAVDACGAIETYVDGVCRRAADRKGCLAGEAFWRGVAAAHIPPFPVGGGVPVADNNGDVTRPVVMAEEGIS